MRGIRLALIGTLAVAAGCSTASPSASVSSQVPAASDQAPDTACSPIDLGSPGGNPLDLTGFWRANDLGYYNMYQQDSCLHWLGQSQNAGEVRGESWTNVFIGSIESDFTVTGRWGDVPYAEILTGNDAGSVTMAIEFGGSGAAESPFLKVTDATGGFGATRLAPDESLSEAVTLDGTLGGNFDHLFGTGCIWIEADGQRYELIGDGGWSFRSDLNLRIEDDRDQVVAREGDPIRITGRTSAGLAADCVENAILILELDPSP